MKLGKSVLYFYSERLKNIYFLNIETNTNIKINGEAATQIYEMIAHGKDRPIDMSELKEMGFVND